MLDAARRAVEISEGRDVAAMHVDDESALALARLAEILGEAASRVSPELRSEHPDVPRRDISDTRNRVVHEYFDLDLEVISAIVRDDLPPLANRLEEILDGLANVPPN